MRKLRQSQVINNFFTLASIIIISVTLTLYVKYILKDPEITKTKVIPLQCEKDTLTKYKVYNQVLLNDSLKALHRGYYKVSGEYSKNNNQKDLISLDTLDSMYIKAISKEGKKQIKKYLDISYTLISKNTQSNKEIKRNSFYSGSILTSFKAGNKEIFKIFTDFRLYDENEIYNRIKCSIEVYKNNAKKLQ